jgi:hypothetical protein
MAKALAPENEEAIYDVKDEPYSPDKKKFIVPTERQLILLTQKYPFMEPEEALHPSFWMDNRLSVRILIWSFFEAKIAAEQFDRLIEPYDNGYYKKSDEESTPIFWTKVTGYQQILGVKKDIVSVRHDLDYYPGEPARKEAHKLYFFSQIDLGQKRLLPKVEYCFLKQFGRIAWIRHKSKQTTIPGYRTDEYIPNLPDHI